MQTCVLFIEVQYGDKIHSRTSVFIVETKEIPKEIFDIMDIQSAFDFDHKTTSYKYNHQEYNQNSDIFVKWKESSNCWILDDMEQNQLLIDHQEYLPSKPRPPFCISKIFNYSIYF